MQQHTIINNPLLSKIEKPLVVEGFKSSQSPQIRKIFVGVGIYIGNGQVIHNLSGTVKVQSLESWNEGFNGFAWGWENNKSLIS